MVSPEFLQRSSLGDCDLLSIFSGERGHVLRLQDSRKLFRLAAAKIPRKVKTIRKMKKKPTTSRRVKRSRMAILVLG